MAGSRTQHFADTAELVGSGGYVSEVVYKDCSEKQMGVQKTVCAKGGNRQSAAGKWPVCMSKFWEVSSSR